MEKVCAWLTIFAALASLLHPVNCEVRSFYKIPEFKANWYKAVEHCNSIGMRLAVLDRASFETELKEVLITSPAYIGGKGVVWVGGNDLSKQGKYHWRATGEPLDYTNWVNNVPDNPDEHCIEFGKISYGHVVLDWQWNDNNCKKDQYFACQLVTV